jgi:hypothetical protein
MSLGQKQVNTTTLQRMALVAAVPLSRAESLWLSVTDILATRLCRRDKVSKTYRPMTESGRAAYENLPAVSGVAHSLASKTSSVLSFNMEDVDNE